jgi:hypothetical protein
VNFIVKQSKKLRMLDLDEHLGIEGISKNRDSHLLLLFIFCSSDRFGLFHPRLLPQICNPLNKLLPY